MTSFRSAAIYSIAGGVLQKALPFLVSLYVARVAGAAYFASFAFSINTANTITAICAMGLAPAILTSLANQSDDGNLKNAIAGTFIISTMIGLIVMMAGYFSSLLEFAAIPSQQAMIGVGLLAPALVLLQTVQSTYQGTNQHRAFFVQSCTLALGVSVAVLLVSLSGAADHIHLAYAIPVFAVSILSSVQLLRRMKVSLGNRLAQGLTQLPKLLGAQIPFAGYTAVWMLSIYLCNFQIARRFSIEDLASYNVGFQWYSMMLLVPATLGGVLIPYFSSTRSKFDFKRNQFRITAIYFLAALPLTVLLFLTTPLLLKLYGAPLSADSILTTRQLVLAGGIAFTVTPALQGYMASRNFPMLYLVSGSWSVVALVGTYMVARSPSEIAFAFLFAYIVIALIILFTMLTQRKFTKGQ
jgi:O-antigen/teichoic acid export membrane protein